MGKKEKEGPLGDYFADCDLDTSFGQNTWEKSESELQRRAYKTAKQRAQIKDEDIDIVFAGDLLNQCIASAYATRGTSRPFIGLYGACSTMAESLSMACAFVDASFAKTAAAITSSHFCAAERQFRFPLEYGGQRTPASQWTVTGSGAVLVSSHSDELISIEKICPGAICDFGVQDINNMGSAMAPAAADTLKRFFRDTKTKPSDYGAVVTGDLGEVGSKLLLRLCDMEKIDLSNHLDCGKMIFDTETQNVKSGGSGCGCSASVLTSYFLPLLEKREIPDILFMATGALMSPTSIQQKESIPAVAHLVHIKAPLHGA